VDTILSQELEQENFRVTLFSPQSPSIKFFNRYSNVGNAITGNSVSVIKPHTINPFWRVVGMGKAANRLDVHVFHGLSNELPVDLPSNIKSVVTIHDVLFRQFPKQYSWMDRQIYHLKTKFALRKAHKIIATSWATAEAIQQYYPGIKNNIEVVYQSIQSEFSDKIPTSASEYNKNPISDSVYLKSDVRLILNDRPYIIYHSTFNQRKNHLRLLQAFQLIMNEVEFNLVLIGFVGNTWNKVKQFCNENDLNSRVVLLNDVSTETLVQWMQGSSGFIYPSLNEGFGIPLAEASALRLPFLVSDVPVFKELLNGNEDYLFDPRDIQSISLALHRLNEVVLNESLLGNWTALHDAVIQKTHPRNVAAQLMNIYQS